MVVAEKMLEFARVGPDDVVYDLGSGDGRIVILAAQKYGARGVGIELDSKLAGQSQEEVKKLDLQGQVRVIEGDILDQDLSPATVVTIYMDPRAMSTLRPHLEKTLRHGTRVVICEGEMPGWKPAATTTAFDEDKKAFPLNLYVMSASGDWTSFSKFGRSPQKSDRPR